MISRIVLILFLFFVINGLVIQSQNVTTSSSETSLPTTTTITPSPPTTTTTQSPPTTTTTPSPTTTTTTPTPTNVTITVTATRASVSTEVSIITTSSIKPETTTSISNSSSVSSETTTTTTTTNATTNVSTTLTTESSTNPSTNETTTPQPTTMPTLPPPTLPPSPDAPTTVWNVSYSQTNGSICLLAEFSLSLRIEYNSDIKDVNYTTGFNIPSNASVDTKNSFCNNITQVLSLNFNIVNQTMGSITFTFNQTNGNIFAEKVKLSYQLTENLFPNYMNEKDYGKMITIENDNLDLFNVDDSHSYGCNSQTNILLINGTQLEISNAKVQAYIQPTSGQFSIVKQCKEDNKSADISNTVPIIVGASLGGLVLIVLIVFFIGRHRSRMAYTSV